ncbi:MAG: hypothetical protein M1336_04505 [Deltaproteobacteria bacterium]|jgi:hypothetical protein|nr:hypothetical protein [Deltaproteobacteria bacterium]
MPARGFYDTVKQAIQHGLGPRGKESQEEITGLRGEMRQLEKRLEEGLSSPRNELHPEIQPSAAGSTLRSTLYAPN